MNGFATLTLGVTNRPVLGPLDSKVEGDLLQSLQSARHEAAEGGTG